MAVLPSCLLDGLWAEISALLPIHEPSPSGGRPRADDRIVYDKLVLIAKTGISYADAADDRVSATTIRSRRDEWQRLGIMEQILQIALETLDRMIGIEFQDVSVDGCITKAPCGGEVAGRSPVDRGKQGLKRSVITDDYGVVLGGVLAGANTHDSVLLSPTLDVLDTLGPLPDRITVHLDRDYDSRATRDQLRARRLQGRIASKGVPAPVQAGPRWTVERSHAWMNHFKKLSLCTERRKSCAQFFLALITAIVATRSLINRAKTHYRW